MPTAEMGAHDTLAVIADVYTPLLALAVLGLIGREALQARWRLAGRQCLALSAALLIAYGVMFLDAKFALWPLVGLDYSTHTAVALVLVLFLLARWRRLWVLWAGSLVAYAGLMAYQHYHSLADILSTAAVVIVPAWWLISRTANDHSSSRCLPVA